MDSGAKKTTKDGRRLMKWQAETFFLRSGNRMDILASKKWKMRKETHLSRCH